MTQLKHLVLVTVSIPDHPMVSKRRNTISKKINVLTDCKESAVERAIKFYKNRGFKIHDHEYIGVISVMA